MSEAKSTDGSGGPRCACLPAACSFFLHRSLARIRRRCWMPASECIALERLMPRRAASSNASAWAGPKAACSHFCIVSGTSTKA